MAIFSFFVSAIEFIASFAGVIFCFTIPAVCFVGAGIIFLKEIFDTICGINVKGLKYITSLIGAVITMFTTEISFYTFSLAFSFFLCAYTALQFLFGIILLIAATIDSRKEYK